MKRKPSLLRTRPLLASVLGLLLVGCAGGAIPGIGSGSPSLAPGQLKVTLLSGGGPLSYGPPNLVAARSVAELKALLHAVPEVQFHGPDSWDAFADRQNQVFISLASGACRQPTAVTATRTGGNVVLIDYSAQNVCGNGAGTEGTPALSLLAIPLGQLGATVVTFQLKGGFGRARVDLRSPQASVDPASVASDAAYAVAAARGKVSSGLRAQVHALDLMRWPDSSLACGPSAASPAALPVVGYLIVVDTSSGYTPQPEEFHWSGGRLVDCGSAPGV